jgi:hypothetical protein
MLVGYFCSGLTRKMLASSWSFYALNTRPGARSRSAERPLSEISLECVRPQDSSTRPTPRRRNHHMQAAHWQDLRRPRMQHWGHGPWVMCPVAPMTRPMALSLREVVRVSPVSANHGCAENGVEPRGIRAPWLAKSWSIAVKSF